MQNVIQETKPKKYITEKALSEITGRALQTLRNDRFLGRGFPYIRIGSKSIRYDYDEAISIMERSKVATTPFPAEGAR